MADWEISQLSVKSSPAAATDYLPILDTTDNSTAPAGAGGSDKRATITSVVNSVPAFAPKGLAGAVQAARFAGATTSGAPVSGTFAAGDFVIDQTAVVWICTAGGSPGTWTAAGSVIWATGGLAYVENSGSGDTALTIIAGTVGGAYIQLACTANYYMGVNAYDSLGNLLWRFGNNGLGGFNVYTNNAGGSGTSLALALVIDYSQNVSFSGSIKPAAGAASLAPLLFQPGTLLTSPAAGAVEFDGTAFYATAQASSRQVVDTEQLVTLTSPYTLTSQTAAQKLFNATANGALTVEASTTYWFECFFTLSSMSASSGAFGFALGGTATLTSQVWETEANKAALATPASAQNTVNTAASTAIVTATTGTAGWAKVWGKVRVSAAGTLIPQVSLGVAAAAVVGADSYFRCWPAGASSVTTVGNWS